MENYMYEMEELEEGGDPLVCMEEGTAQATSEGVGTLANQKLVNQKQPTRECPICYDAKVCTPLANCNHFFCEECLSSHVRHCMRDVPISCPRSTEAPACTKSISMTEIQDMIPARDFLEYQKTVRIHSDPTLISCPSCDELTLPNNQENNRFVTCSECMHEFCDLHGNAHELTVEACKKMARAQDDRLTIQTIQRVTKPCSTCQAPIEKSGGCDYIRCAACNTLWRSGDVKTEFEVACLDICLILFILFLCVCATVYMMIGIAVFIVSVGCCFCCCCGRTLSERADDPSLHGPRLGLRVAAFWTVMPLVEMLSFLSFDCPHGVSRKADYVFGR